RDSNPQTTTQDGILLNPVTDVEKVQLYTPEQLILINIVTIQEEGDPDWRMDIHCYFCKRATKLKDLLPFNINNNKYERCRGCQKKGKEHTPEREKLHELRKSQIKKRERTQSSKPMMIKRTKTNPPEIKNVYANGLTYNPER
ncbi:4457_t:CDS:2, partial [Dentiscutata erythropus]